MQAYQSFKFMNFDSTRTVTCSDWHPSLAGVVAVAYAKPVTLQQRIATQKPNDKAYILIWGLSDPIQPKLILEAPEDVFSVQFCPTHPAYVVAGCLNGQLVVFDLGKHARRLGSSSTKVKNFTAAFFAVALLPALPFACVCVCLCVCVSVCTCVPVLCLTHCCWQAAQ